MIFFQFSLIDLIIIIVININIIIIIIIIFVIIIILYDELAKQSWVFLYFFLLLTVKNRFLNSRVCNFFSNDLYLHLLLKSLG